MEFGWSDELLAFREEVLAFVQESLTPAFRAELATADDHGQVRGPLTNALNDEVDRRGWLRRSWPAELGGGAESPWYGFILSLVIRSHGITFGRGAASMIAPAIQRFGTEEQRKRFVPALLSGEISCALGYSEPDAGTDLASLKTRAVRDGDDYVINGQKIWTSGAHMSDHVWLATRTDPEAPKHRGISVFILPLNLPGISIRPIWTMAGVRTNETFYENVRVPAANLIGEENRGWYIIANALDHERVTVGINDYIDLIDMWDRFIPYMQQNQPGHFESDSVRRKLAEIKTDLHFHRALLLSNAALVAAGETPTMEASMVKVWGSELRHRMTDIMMDVMGRYGVLSKGSGEPAPLDGRIEQQSRFAPIVRFAGGTNEIQRNIIAQRGLGLPR
jgi:alkylation response protein AidB-like acyl-CoA dehydrogenase